VKNYRTWLKAAAVFQLITAVMHAIALFVTPAPNNETEKQLFELMGTYRFDFGAGFHRTMDELTLALSSCLSLLCILGGLITFYLLKKRVGADIMQGIITLNLIIFGIFFILTISFTFLLPISQIGLILLFLILSRLTLHKTTTDDKQICIDKAK